MLYPIELWVRPKSTGNYKSNKARASAICAPRSLRGFNRLEPDRLQVQRLEIAFDRTEGQGYLSRRGDFKEAELRNFELAIVASGGDCAAAAAVANDNLQGGFFERGGFGSDFELAGPGDLEGPFGPIGGGGPEAQGGGGGDRRRVVWGQ